MTEEQIELRVEKRTDALDAMFLAGEITQEVYNREIALLDDWAGAQLAKARA